MHVIGHTAIYGGLILSLYSFFMIMAGIKKQKQRLIDSGKGGIYAVFFLACLAVGILLFLLATNQFQYEYVAHYTSTDLALVYKLTALWAGNAGSLLLWAFLLGLYSMLIISSAKLKQTPMIPYIALIMLANMIFFFLVLALLANPFALADNPMPEGNGLNPMLQAPGMILHPVTLFLGYVGLSVPFAFAVAALILKNIDAYWIRMTRRWTLIAWLFLTLGNLIGGFWAYMELGWGGYWAWDPVENASFMPWLTVTAFLHSVMIQERKNLLKVWNLSLIMISYVLTLFGTFLVRSGVLTSVHAFANSALSHYFLLFFALAVLFSLWILMSRYHLLKRDHHGIDSFFSKESSFLLNNLILLGAGFAVFWGTIFPLVSELFNGTKVNVGIPFFNTVMPPILLTLLILMGVCPLISWQRASSKQLFKHFIIPAIISFLTALTLVVFGIRGAYPLISFTIVAFMIAVHLLDIYRGVRARRKMAGEAYAAACIRLFIRNRRRYGGYIVHIGIAMIALGIIGSNQFDVEKTATLQIGETLSLGGYQFTYKDIGVREEKGKDTIFAKMEVKVGGKDSNIMTPEKVFYQNWDQPSSEVALLSRWKEDVYIVLSSWEKDGKATFLFKLNPLVKWIWTGGIVVVLGTLFALWKGKYSHITPRYSGVQRKVS